MPYGEVMATRVNLFDDAGEIAGIKVIQVNLGPERPDREIDSACCELTFDLGEFL